LIGSLLNSFLFLEFNAIFCNYRQRVLVIGGGGAVGLAAVQLAVAAGCGVSATCGTQSIERVTGAGAEQAIDYTAEVSSLWCSCPYTIF
jgi:NADPH:quinone reductase-like Zn-dependent oxidoreductase